jgi:hypothetical protein
VLAYEYPGYGLRHDEKPTEKKFSPCFIALRCESLIGRRICGSASTAWNYAATFGKKIILYGRGLGVFPAMYLANDSSKRSAALVVHVRGTAHAS